MKYIKIIPALLIIFSSSFLFAQEQQQEKPKIYHPEADVLKDYAMAMEKAASEGKHVMLMVGGNWCKWCLRFDDFLKKNHELDSTLKANFVLLHVNFSKENKNLPFLETFSYPQRFGFPVFVVINANGDRIHTQSSWYLEDGKDSYDPKKVMAFFTDWSLSALDPSRYTEDAK